MPLRDGPFVNWTHTLKIKHLLKGGSSDANAQKVAKEIAAVIQGARFMADWRRADALASIRTCDELNDVLSSLYDYADANLIWVA